MGRYAFFNTNFEYKFIYGLQASEDILLFGGHTLTINKESPIQMWKSSDKENILQILQANDFHVEFENYEKNINGTYALHKDLKEKFSDFLEINESIIAAQSIYENILGSLIYHQLLYTNELIAKYEV